MYAYTSVCEFVRERGRDVERQQKKKKKKKSEGKVGKSGALPEKP